MDLYLYNSLTRKKERFVPINPPNVGLYTCGPTVYNFAHIGNLRTYIFNDILHRVLLYDGFKVKRVMNITDVGHLTGDRDMGVDKVEEAASGQRKDAWALSRFYLDAFKNDMERLNMLPPTVWEKATDTIPEQVKMIKLLEEKGFTYKTSDGIYFDTSKFADYGKMSSLDKKGIKEAARVDFNPERKNPSDFALWKFNVTGKKRQMEWESPWGVGFPGWHIECSAISTKHLGNPFDVHTGAIDHKEIHHPNEIAQTECATGEKMANCWLHAGFLNTESAEKMSKSKGNFVTLQTLIDKGYDPLAFRYYTFGIHWRQTSNLSWEALGAAQTAYRRLVDFVAAGPSSKPRNAQPPFSQGTRGLYRGLRTNPNETAIGVSSDSKSFSYSNSFATAINDDLNMPEALALVWKLIKDEKVFYEEKMALLVEWDEVLGLKLKNQKSKVKSESQKLKVQIPKEITMLVKEREELRRQKKFDEADKLRLEIEEKGYKVEDSEEGSKLSPNLFPLDKPRIL